MDSAMDSMLGSNLPEFRHYDLDTDRMFLALALASVRRAIVSKQMPDDLDIEQIQNRVSILLERVVASVERTNLALLGQLLVRGFPRRPSLVLKQGVYRSALVLGLIYGEPSAKRAGQELLESGQAQVLDLTAEQLQGLLESPWIGEEFYRADEM